MQTPISEVADHIRSHFDVIIRFIVDDQDEVEVKSEIVANTIYIKIYASGKARGVIIGKLGAMVKCLDAIFYSVCRKNNVTGKFQVM